MEKLGHPIQLVVPLMTMNPAIIDEVQFIILDTTNEKVYRTGVTTLESIGGYSGYKEYWDKWATEAIKASEGDQ